MNTNTAPCLIDAVADPASVDASEILDESALFRSPFADYSGRSDISHLLGLISEVLTELRPARRLSSDAATMTLFDARVADEDVQGVLCEERDGDGRVTEALLTVRPYSGLQAAMRAMGTLMEASPLPSARGLGANSDRRTDG
ncbi:MAG: hypothetical protein WBW44_12010 [Solirubrobacterales bacterium]